jgi:hypothetical protein
MIFPSPWLCFSLKTRHHPKLVHVSFLLARYERPLVCASPEGADAGGIFGRGAGHDSAAQQPCHGLAAARGRKVALAPIPHPHPAVRPAANSRGHIWLAMITQQASAEPGQQQAGGGGC